MNTLSGPEFFQNRELSWLDFNRRVLAEAESAAVPLLERCKFAAIVSSNLDEFFMVRVALVHRAAEAEAGPLGPDQRPPKQVLESISAKSHALVDDQYACLNRELLPALAEAGVELVRTAGLSLADREHLGDYFDSQILPVLTPLAVDPAHPFPLLANCAVYLLFQVKPHELETGQKFFARADTVLMQVPVGLRRFVSLPAASGRLRLALLEDVIGLFAERALRGYSVVGSQVFRVTRDAEFTVDEEQSENLLSAVEQQLRSRRRGVPVRLELEAGGSPAIEDYLRVQLGLAEADIYRAAGPADLRCLFALPGLVDRPELSDPAWLPQRHPRLTGDEDLFSVIREQDLALLLPYHSFDPVVEFVRQAAGDPEVLAIKITLYRVAGGSPLVQALIAAAENGKQVTALIELRARFDEEANINWARRLDAAGAHVIYGVVGYKTHAKTCLVVRREEGGIRRYVHLSTGNYNDRTARLYTDVALFTARPEFGADISAFFNVITGYSLPPKWHRIAMAPTGLRERFIGLIEREIERHSPETPGFLRGKMNSLIDPQIIGALYRASQAGVKIDLAVRGMTRLRAGVKGMSENIRLVSVVDRFLEHPRIYYFHNGGDEEVYCASADWMERNLDSRLELLFPVVDAEARRLALRNLELTLADNVKAWELGPDDVYRRRPRSADEAPQRSQEILYREAAQAAKVQSTQRRQSLFVAKTAPESRPARRKRGG